MNELEFYEQLSDEPAHTLIPFRVAIAVAIEDEMRDSFGPDLTYSYGLLWNKDSDGMISLPPTITKELTDYEYVDYIFAEIFFRYV